MLYLQTSQSIFHIYEWLWMFSCFDIRIFLSLSVFNYVWKRNYIEQVVEMVWVILSLKKNSVSDVHLHHWKYQVCLRLRNWIYRSRLEAPACPAPQLSWSCSERGTLPTPATSIRLSWTSCGTHVLQTLLAPLPAGVRSTWWRRREC